MIKAFILAAGFGERLRPITYHLPKPLLPVLGKPVLTRLLERITRISPSAIGINTHYKAEMFSDWASKSAYAEKVEFFDEREILGTGGALKNAENFLRGSTFIVHNADIISDIDLTAVIQKHKDRGSIATLAVHDHHCFNNVWVDKDGRLLFIGDQRPDYRDSRRVAFTGVAVYSSEFLDILPAGRSGVVDAWLGAAALGLDVNTVDVTGCRWRDIGTAEAYSSIVFSLLKEDGEVIYIHPDTDCMGIDLGAETVIEQGCVIEKGVSIRRSILLPGSKVQRGAAIENSILGPGYVISLKESRPLPPSSLSGMNAGLQSGSSNGSSMALVGVGGSDRKYYRIREQDRTAILMECFKDDPDYQRHIIYTRFLKKYSVPVPELLGSDIDDKMTPIFERKDGYVYALFEDLGDISLYSWLKCQRETLAIEELYKRVLNIMINLHTKVSDNMSDCPLLRSRVFDAAHLRWETDYFMERFVSRLSGITIPTLAQLDREFDCLAERVDSFEKVVIHRDFQSQNVMIATGDIPRIIDYQGARVGPQAYDLVSLLWDPYYLFDTRSRERLLRYYIEGIRGYAGDSFNEEAFREGLIPCRLQRHMQALGAYGFLSANKDRSYFLRYVPRALQYLKDEVKTAKNEYPLLSGFIAGLDAQLEN